MRDTSDSHDHSAGSAYDDLSLIRDAAVRLLEAHAPSDLIRDIYARIASHLGAELYFHYLYQANEDKLRLECCAGIDAAATERIRWLNLGDGVSGKVAQSRSVCMIENMRDDPDPAFDTLRGLGVRAYCCYPLTAGRQLIGTLSFGTRAKDAFADEELRLLQIVCDLVAISLQRAQAEIEREQLLKDERQARGELQDALDAVRLINETLEDRVQERTQTLVTYQDQLRSLASELTLTEQHERHRIASDLHDHLAQLLVACKMKLAVLRDADRPTRQAATAEIDQFLTDALMYTRTLIADISPIALYERGLIPAIHWLAEAVMPNHGLCVEVLADHLGPDAADGLSDELRIMVFQSLRELLFNVIKHAQVDRATVRLRSADDGLELIVRDAGTGFEDTGETTVTAAGGGFGLFSIQERMTLAGGRFEVASSPGQGTRAVIWVPRCKPAAVPPPVIPVRQRIHDATGDPRTDHGGRLSSSLRVLVVDDHAVVREGLMMILAKQKGIVVVGEAEDGYSAIEMARQLRPDVVLMDVSMPGMGGVEATRHLTKEHPHLKVIGLSMYDDEGVARAMRAAGATAHLYKGCSDQLLTATLRQTTPQTPTFSI